MKIAQVGALAGPNAIAGGVWAVQRTQSTALTEAGHEVRALAGWLGPLPGRNREPFQLDLTRVRPPFPGAGLRATWSIHLPEALHNLASWADVAHVHLCRDLFTVPSVRAFRTAGVPVVAQTHGMLAPPRNRLQTGYDRFITRDALSVVDVFLYLTERERSDLRALGVPAAKLKQIANASAIPSTPWTDPGNPHLVFASRLHRRKQPLVFVDAALQLLAIGIKATFSIAGPDQGEGAAVQSRIDGADASECIRVLGALSHDSLLRLLSRSTALVLPSLDEPYPMVVVEALGMGVPTIMTQDTGIRDLVAVADAAFLVNPTPNNVAHAMRKTIEDRALRANLSARGKELYEAVWRPSSLGERLIRLYEDVVQAAPRRLSPSRAEVPD